MFFSLFWGHKLAKILSQQVFIKMKALNIYSSVTATDDDWLKDLDLLVRFKRDLLWLSIFSLCFHWFMCFLKFSTLWGAGCVTLCRLKSAHLAAVGVRALRADKSTKCFFKHLKHFCQLNIFISSWNSSRLNWTKTEVLSTLNINKSVFLFNIWNTTSHFKQV